MRRSFHFDDLPETEFLVFDLLTDLQGSRVAGDEVWRGIVLDRFHVGLGWNIRRPGLFFVWRGAILFFRSGSGISESGPMHAVIGGRRGRRIPKSEPALVARTPAGKAAIQMIFGNLFNKTAWLVLHERAKTITGISVSDPQFVLGAGDHHIKQSSFLFQF